MTRKTRHRWVSVWRLYGRRQRGAAAAEFALVLGLLTIPILNAVDVAFYFWSSMQVDNAAQMAAQTAWTTCNSGTLLPALTKCTGLTAAVTTAAQSTSLGGGVSVGTLTEAYYCPNSAGTDLVAAGTASDCSAINGNKENPGDYLLIPVSYTYTPIFSGVSVVSLLTSPITNTARMRLE